MEYQLITSCIPQEMQLSAVERVLTNRGIGICNIKHYLNTDDNDILSPRLIKNIEEGAKLLCAHIANEDDIFIQVDSDCDGFTSASLLINYLYMIFPVFVKTHIKWRIHDGKEHGILPDTIPEGVKMVIAPDSSSNDYDEHQYLKTMRDIDILVIDHHEAEKESEYACIINNQLCDYPTKSLSGVGMVYKFCCYIDELLNIDYAENFVDLVALGMIADMMDLRDFETKHLINIGLEHIRNPFFSMMVEKQSYSLKDEITPIGIAFYIAPYVNATIRMGSKEEKEILFESMLDFKAYSQIPSTKRGARGQKEMLVEQACRNCTNIKNRQTKARDSALESIERIIKDKNLLENKVLAIKLEPEHATDKNLTGLIANQLMAKYQRPVLLLNKKGGREYATNAKGVKLMTFDTPITWEGSGRNYDKSKFDNFREFLNESNLVLYAEGHANALGVGIADEYFDAFIQYANKELAEYDFTPCYKVDFIFNGGDFRPKDIIEIAELKSIWGQGISEPYIALENVKITESNITLMSADRSPTIKITLPNGVSLIKFKSSKEEYESLKTKGLITLNVVGRCERNIWNGNVSAQILIEDYDIVGRTEYYF